MVANSARMAAVLAIAAGVLAGCNRANGVSAAEQESEVKTMDEEGKPEHRPGRIVKPDAEWRKELTLEQYRITRLKGTERPFTGKYWNHKAEGVYNCVGCGLPLFISQTKYDSGCGWPSYWEPVYSANIIKRRDASHGMVRTETLCARCGAHLGHVFNDGPKPTGMRYCINSASLDFTPAREEGSTVDNAKAEGKVVSKAMFAAGCFWGVESTFRRVEGVIDTAVGYSGGPKENPTYREVCTDRTGHAEVVLVTYDPARVTYGELLDVFWRVHDPTQRDGQRPDIGRQYRSVVFYFGEEQRRAAEEAKRKLEGSGRYARGIATAIEPAGRFWRAEEYHQRYNEKRGSKSCPVR